jgi:hypothetical protein
MSLHLRTASPDGSPVSSGFRDSLSPSPRPNYRIVSRDDYHARSDSVPAYDRVSRTSGSALGNAHTPRARVLSKTPSNRQHRTLSKAPSHHQPRTLSKAPSRHQPRTLSKTTSNPQHRTHSNAPVNPQRRSYISVSSDDSDTAELATLRTENSQLKYQLERLQGHLDAVVYVLISLYIIYPLTIKSSVICTMV